MSRRVLAALVAATLFSTLSAATVGATVVTTLSLSQNDAFAILGHACGGITEQTYATGFDLTTGFPTGDVFAQTTCSSGGRGSRPSTFSAWISVTWDYTGTVVTDGALSTAATVDPSFHATDGFGNQLTNASGSATLTLSDSFTPTPRVTGMSLSRGPSAGGSVVTITGSGFSNVTDVSFGAVSAMYSVIDTNDISVTTPPSTGGTVNVTVAVGSLVSATSSVDEFTFVPTPIVSAISPPRGPLTGGTDVTISGSGFATVNSVSFGDTGVGFTVVNDSTITTVSPPGESAEATPVFVTSLGGTSSVSSNSSFSYRVPAPVLTLSPVSGPVGTAVTITGRNFVAGTHVVVTYATKLKAPRRSTVVVCRSSVATDGTFTCGTTITKATAGRRGVHTVAATATSSGGHATSSFTLT